MNHWTLCALDVWYILRWIAPATATLGIPYLWKLSPKDKLDLPRWWIGTSFCIAIYIAAIAGWWL